MMTMESEAAGTATLNALDDDNHNGDEYHRQEGKDNEEEDDDKYSGEILCGELFLTESHS